MYPHFIRLRGPWEMSVGEGPPLIVKMPARWDAPPLSNLHGPVRCLRKFGAPRQLDDGEFVWLVFRDFPTAVEAQLNGKHLGTSQVGAFEFPVSLKPRNRLELTMSPPTERACAWGEVAMEIRRSAWLCQLSLTPVQNEWTLTGSVVGTSAEPLELYVMVGGRQLHYQEIEPRPEGQPFATRFAWPDLREIKVDLVNVATVWYSQILQAPGTATSLLS